MLHYELPPTAKTDPYDNFYLDWDSYYNKEPFYKAVRSLNFEQMLSNLGFGMDQHVSFLVPSIMSFGEEEIVSAAKASNQNKHDSRLSRLVKGVKWYTFGAWKTARTP